MLELSAEEMSMFPNQLNAILDRVAELGQLDIDGVDPTAHPFELSNVFRPDNVAQPTEVREAALAAAPQVEDNQYRVPPALGQEL